ncbi:ethanolamine kinase, putative [Plasmodium ovale wallikeri]|uniref:ethanolamine kinase n=2 Tax=Plasmodium ovale TaxID=36330 RepID=A0A1A8YV48_PLAOA|nr:ethanolamine kinase, putative [Plasmodium ovale wallikeri]SBT35786.1 ethanolamine kinase, putative [Plasmodium ovale wallikeri]SBT77126.1 ethanolamine kinase, putative [Plasmodium ovale]
MEKRRKVDAPAAVMKEEGGKRNNSCTLRSFNSVSSTNSQITETKNKQGLIPLTENDLKINIGDDKNAKVEEFMKTFLNNVFENKNVLFIYCKYVMFYYGKGLINKNEIDSLHFETINGGITNILVKVENSLEKKKFLIRLYGPKTSQIINREREKLISDILYDKKISKKIYVFFPNGRIEEFMEGYALSREDIKNESFQKEIAKNLRILHNISLSDSLCQELQNLQQSEMGNFDASGGAGGGTGGSTGGSTGGGTSSGTSGGRTSFLWATIWKYFHALNEERQKTCPFDSKANVLKLIDFDMLKKTISEIEELCNKKNSPIVLCHCDLLSSNIINTTSNTISFIDFEYSCPMERAYDIANHFNEYAGFNCEWDLIPSKEEEFNFVKHYLNTEDDVLINQLIDEIQPFYVCSHINWGLWALLQGMHSPIDFDFINYGMTRLTASCLTIFRSKVKSQAQ